MIRVTVPEAFFSEREYLCKVIFGEFLGLEFIIESENSLKDAVEIDIAQKKIILQDHFFSKISEKEGYLDKSLIPQKVNFVKSEYAAEADVPLLFGIDSVSFSGDMFVCGHDIFASVFFMLARWEERVVEDRDYLGRFPAESSLAMRFGFLHRPVVNEWVALLKNIIRKMNPEIQFNPPQRYGIVFTHDIDLLNSPATLREFAKDILKRKSITAFAKRFGYLLSGNNPYDVFDYFMDTSERHNTLSRFYFMTGHNVPGKDGEPYNSTTFYKTILNRIKKRGHVVGFHPSLLSYNNPEMFMREKMELESDVGKPVAEGRQHALRFNMPETWTIWEQADMELDSTMGYSAREGFRCGTGNVFTVFDVVRRKTLRLKEMPLVLMDTTLNVNRKLTIDESKDIIGRYIATGKKYEMPVTLLFHNLINDSIDWNGWRKLYDELFWN